MLFSYNARNMELYEDFRKNYAYYISRDLRLSRLLKFQVDSNLIVYFQLHVRSETLQGDCLASLVVSQVFSLSAITDGRSFTEISP
jgi:hypothetical protein